MRSDARHYPRIEQVFYEDWTARAASQRPLAYFIVFFDAHSIAEKKFATRNAAKKFVAAVRKSGKCAVPVVCHLHGRNPPRAPSTKKARVGWSRRRPGRGKNPLREDSRPFTTVGRYVLHTDGGRVVAHGSLRVINAYAKSQGMVFVKNAKEALGGHYEKSGSRYYGKELKVA